MSGRRHKGKQKNGRSRTPRRKRQSGPLKRTGSRRSLSKSADLTEDEKLRQIHKRRQYQRQFLDHSEPINKQEEHIDEEEKSQKCPSRSESSSSSDSSDTDNSTASDSSSASSSSSNSGESIGDWDGYDAVAEDVVRQLSLSHGVNCDSEETESSDQPPTPPPHPPQQKRRSRKSRERKQNKTAKHKDKHHPPPEAKVKSTSNKKSRKRSSDPRSRRSDGERKEEPVEEPVQKSKRKHNRSKKRSKKSHSPIEGDPEHEEAVHPTIDEEKKSPSRVAHGGVESPHSDTSDHSSTDSPSSSENDEDDSDHSDDSTQTLGRTPGVIIYDGPPQCMICLSDLDGGDNIPTRSLSCSHVFHVDCIEPWEAMKNNCPVCRLVIDRERAKEERRERRRLRKERRRERRRERRARRKQNAAIAEQSHRHHRNGGSGPRSERRRRRASHNSNPYAIPIRRSTNSLHRSDSERRRRGNRELAVLSDLKGFFTNPGSPNDIRCCSISMNRIVSLFLPLSLLLYVIFSALCNMAWQGVYCGAFEMSGLCCDSCVDTTDKRSGGEGDNCYLGSKSDTLEVVIVLYRIIPGLVVFFAFLFMLMKQYVCLFFLPLFLSFINITFIHLVVCCYQMFCCA